MNLWDFMTYHVLIPIGKLTVSHRTSITTKTTLDLFINSGSCNRYIKVHILCIALYYIELHYVELLY